KCAAWEVTGPVEMEIPFFTLPVSGRHNLRFHFTDDNGTPYRNTPFIAYLPDGSTIEAKTDKNGYTSTFYSDDPQNIDVQLLI
ncbi:hypothetical protein, partial [Neisseria sp. MVDL19-042950]|uniref:hypothetical protein n=1 Tax=Neisseria sp. MVDL19-042950 TaxID=3061169 RepID=UPI00265DD1B2